MKNKKLNGLVTSDSRQLELIDKYYYLDKEKKIIDVDLNYDSTDDILDKEIGNPNNPQFSKNVLETMDSIIENIPTGYKVDINLVLKDYKGYDPKVLMETFNNTLELRRYSSRKKKLNKQVFSGMLIFIGISIMLLMIICRNYIKFGNDIQDEIFNEVLDIAAWVFVWEAVTILFLDDPGKSKLALEIRRKVNKITFYTHDNEEPLLSETNDEIFKNWESISRIKTASRYMLLVSSVAFLFLAVYSIYDFFKNFNEATQLVNVVVVIIVGIVQFIVKIFAGVSGIKLFLNKPVKHYKLLGAYSVIVFIGFCFSIIGIIVSKETIGLASSIASMLISLMFSVGFFMYKYSK